MTFEEELKLKNQQLEEEHNQKMEEKKRQDEERKQQEKKEKKEKRKAIVKKIIKGLKRGFVATVLSPVNAVKGIKKFANKKKLAKQEALKQQAEEKQRKIEEEQRFQQKSKQSTLSLVSKYDKSKVGRGFLSIEKNVTEYDNGKANERYGWEHSTTTTVFIHTENGPLQRTEIDSISDPNPISNLVRTHSCVYEGFIKLTTNSEGLQQIAYVSVDKNGYGYYSVNDDYNRVTPENGGKELFNKMENTFNKEYSDALYSDRER